MWLKEEAAAAGVERIHQKMARAVELSVLSAGGDLDWALGRLTVSRIAGRSHRPG